MFTYNNRLLYYSLNQLNYDKSDFIACGIVLGAILAIVGVLSTTLPMTVTAQNTTDILTTTKNIHNTTLPGDTIVHRGIISSEVPAHLVLRSR